MCCCCGWRAPSPQVGAAHCPCAASTRAGCCLVNGPTNPRHPIQSPLAEFGVSYLGWNASGWAPPTTTAATLSHPGGTLLQLSRAAPGLTRSRRLADGTAAALNVSGGAAAGSGAATHYRVQWRGFGTDAGSSGAPLLDAAAPTMVGGVLTGGSREVCDGRDFFGSLRAAWERGLWRVLSPGGPEAVTSMPAAAGAAADSSSTGDAAGGADVAAASGAAVLEQLEMQGQRLDDSLPAGSTPTHPLLIQASSASDGGAGLDYSSAGQLSLPAEADAGPPPALRLGQPLGEAAAALPPGAAVFFSLSPAMAVNASVWACSPDAALQLAVFPGGGPATWSA